jgi:SAM-dependent methyltransferase
MGIDMNCVQLLLRAKKNGASFERMATLGRQWLRPNRSELIRALLNAGCDISPASEQKLRDPAEIYADEFLHVLGAKQVTAIDANAFEGAQVVHDMNRPLPDSLDSAFDVVLDGGTLEHVFDFPTALRNTMRMVKPGGLFISCTMANNFAGHGFYQFSPELFHRVLCKDNGYSIESCIIWEDIQNSKFYDFPDPDSLNSRVQITSRSGTYLFVQAKRTGNLSPDFVPQQSDYVKNWKAASSSQISNGGSAWKSALRENILRSLRETKMFRQLLHRNIYRRLQLSRNKFKFLMPLEDLRVKL